jgi:hypothetical protein
VHGITDGVSSRLAVEAGRIDLELAETLPGDVVRPGTEQPENMTEQAERPLNPKGESRGVDICGPKWPEQGPDTPIDGGLDPSNMVLLQRFSRVERVTGIEPALSAWEEFLSSRVSLSCNDIGGLS